jgi:hypothetical protein
MTHTTYKGHGEEKIWKMDASPVQDIVNASEEPQ